MTISSGSPFGQRFVSRARAGRARRRMAARRPDGAQSATVVPAGARGSVGQLREEAARLKKHFQPRRLAVAVEMPRLTGPALPLREQDPAQVRKLDRDRSGEEGEELLVPHALSIVTER